MPPSTAARVNADPRTRRAGRRGRHDGRARARDAGDDDGPCAPFDGWTDLVITPERGVRVVDGLLTGWHEPEASHLLMLEAVAGRDAARALLRGAASPRATCGTSSATST